MRLLIASDIHGAADWCARLMKVIEVEDPDRVVLLGDLLYHGPRNDLPRDYAPKRVIEMLNSIARQVIAVRGNCDAEVDQMVWTFPAWPTTTCSGTPTPRTPSREDGGASSFSRMATCGDLASTIAWTRGPRYRRERPLCTGTRTSGYSRRTPTGMRTRASRSSIRAA